MKLIVNLILMICFTASLSACGGGGGSSAEVNQEPVIIDEPSEPDLKWDEGNWNEAKWD